MMNGLSFLKNITILRWKVDGPSYIHDANRVNWKGKPSHELVMNGLSILDKYNIPYAAIAVVSEHSLDIL